MRGSIQLLDEIQKLIHSRFVLDILFLAEGCQFKIFNDSSVRRPGKQMVREAELTEQLAGVLHNVVLLVEIMHVAGIDLGCFNPAVRLAAFAA